MSAHGFHGFGVAFGVLLFAAVAHPCHVANAVADDPGLNQPDGQGNPGLQMGGRDRGLLQGERGLLKGGEGASGVKHQVRPGPAFLPCFILVIQ